MKKYNEKNICENCGKEFGQEWSNKPVREIKNNHLTGKWICGYCRDREYKKKDKELRSRIKTQKKYYNKTNTCDGIKENNEKCNNNLTKGNALKEINKEGNWTGKWI